MPAVTRDATKRPPKPRTAGPGRARKTTGAQGRARSQDHIKMKAMGAGLQPRTALMAAVVVLAAGLTVLLATGGRLQRIQQDLGDAALGQLAKVGFKVETVELEGASRFSAPYLLHAAGVERGEPILGLNLAELRARVEKVGWVKSVRVLRLLPDTLVIAVAERPRLAVWQFGGRSRVVDPDGQVIPEADPGLFVDLPLIVGDGANEAASAILPEIQSRPRLMSRLEALVRVDGRRWDLRLKDGGLIQLPASSEDSALIQLDQLDQQQRLLDLGFERIDLRDPEMIAVRPRQPVADQAAGTSAAGAPTPSAGPMALKAVAPIKIAPPAPRLAPQPTTTAPRAAPPASGE